ncbi:MAG: sugar transferase [Clostridia bacterium]|nr:sugar transferase [Clostridia bacterium]
MEKVKNIESIKVKTSIESKELMVIKNKKILYPVIKRTVDIMGGIVGVLILIPVLIVVWIMRKKNKEDGPLFYDQLRIGKNGKVFKLYKFRSMVIGADDALKKYLEENPKAKKEYTKYKKLRYDPRITKSGKFLRKTSLDEWPQFINILKGDMSLVGPRPYLPREKEDMGIYYDYIIKVKPGLSGPWQIGGRSKVSFEDRMQIDREYIQNLSLKTDLKILFTTFVKVFKKDGAG